VPPVALHMNISAMSHLMEIGAPRLRTCRNLSSGRRLRNGPGRQAERRENEDAEYQQRESYQSDLDS